MYPIETLGMVVATFAMFIGLFVIALPVIIIGGHFEDVSKHTLQNRFLFVLRRMKNFDKKMHGRSALRKCRGITPLNNPVKPFMMKFAIIAVFLLVSRAFF